MSVVVLQERLSLGALPVARFILATLGLLVADHHSDSLSLLLNSGVLALTQSILRLAGEGFYLSYCIENNELGLNKILTF